MNVYRQSCSVQARSRIFRSSLQLAEPRRLGSRRLKVSNRVHNGLEPHQLQLQAHLQVQVQVQLIKKPQFSPNVNPNLNFKIDQLLRASSLSIFLGLRSRFLISSRIPVISLSV
mmetsp:Transcript_18071/g.35532  ORF Transcript_18071/g.35532 Transcript_18071/m.35532 type:complete len:114 (+) Transcript_18071:813-1154(+)